jgi:aminobenzoyl-glutamate transport protein
VLARLLDAVEWVGNKLPDPTVLFLFGLFVVMGVSHLVAPRLPEGFQTRWTVSKAAGGPDERVASIGLVGTDAQGRETFRTAAFKGVAGADGRLAAHLVFDDTGEAVVDAQGAPIDMAERGWAVFTKRPATVDDGAGGTRLELVPTGQVTFARSLLTSEGWFWLLSSMERNFLNFAPLGVVLLGMLGIGPMEKVGLIGALLRGALARVPRVLLTPAMVFLGVMSSMGSDAGYVVLPPLAALAYRAVGRSPLAGIAAVFAGVSAGFNANLLITSLEPLISNLSQDGARVIDPDRVVVATSSWYFMAVSTVLLTFVGWATTAVFVEKRLSRKSAADGGPDGGTDGGAVVGGGGTGSGLTGAERRGLAWAGAAFVAALGLVAAMVFWKGSPLHGSSGVTARWVAVIVPLMFLLTIVPAMVYGVCVGVVKNTKDAARTMIESMASMAPIIVLAFFAGQFVSAFGESELGRMLAFSGGEWLFEQRLGAVPLLLAFIVVTMFFNLFVGSMSAKYALFAPIFVPMFMLVGIRPELTQVAYRIGDSTTNIITPLNAYLVIILMYVQKYAPKAGIGTLIAMMLPYTVAFTLAWAVLLILWYSAGLPLGPGDPMRVFSPAYEAAHAGATP